MKLEQIQNLAFDASSREKKCFLEIKIYRRWLPNKTICIDPLTISVNKAENTFIAGDDPRIISADDVLNIRMVLKK